MTELTDEAVKALLDRGAQLYNDAKHHLPLQARCADLARALLDARAERDRLVAENAALEAKVARLVGAAEPFMTKPVLADSRALIRAINQLRAALAKLE